MEPVLNRGDMIALKACSASDIQYGGVYAAVMGTFRTVRILRRSDTDDMVRFVPINTDGYDAQEFPLSRITRVYAAQGQHPEVLFTLHP